MNNELKKIGTLAKAFCGGRVHPSLMLVEEILAAFEDFHIAESSKGAGSRELFLTWRAWEEFKEGALYDFSEAAEWRMVQGDYRYFMAHCRLIKMLSRDPYTAGTWRKFRENCGRDNILGGYIDRLMA